MKTTYAVVKSSLDTLDFNLLNEGFKPYPFALYNHDVCYFRDAYHPITDHFRGNTTILYEGGYIAIWNMTFDPNIDIHDLTSGIVHEMYHAHQLTHHKTEYPEDLLLIRQDLCIDYLYLLYQEGLSLIKASLRGEIAIKHQCLKEVLALRKARQNLNSDLFKQELNLENFEGIAEYVGYKALCLLSPDQGRKKLQSYIDDLRTMKHLLNLRWLTYGKSTLFFYLMESLNIPFNNVDNISNPNYFQDVLNTFSQDDLQMPVDQKEATLDRIKSIDHELRVKNKEAIKDFHKKNPSKKNLEGMICGYDPLNMFRYEEFILCKHFIALDFGKGPEFIKGPVLLKIDKSHPMKIHHYYV